MTCNVIDLGGGRTGVVCTGPGKWRVARDVVCPWCLEEARCLRAPVFGGYCGFAYICGHCGAHWESELMGEDPGLAMRKIQRQTPAEDRKNIGLVAETPDPKCWKCHDTGDSGQPWDEPWTHPCGCGAAPREG